MLRKAGNCDIEVVGVVSFYVTNEVNPMDKTAFNCLPDVFPSRRIPSQSQNITTSMLLRGLGKENTVNSPNDGRSQEERTSRAISIFSGCMFVHVRCMHVSIPMVP